MINKTRILIVDDEPQIQKLLRTGLSGFGYDVLLTPPGQISLSSITAEQPDVVILDVNLSAGQQEAPDGLDGLELCQQLRQQSAVPIIMLTVHDDKRTRLAALNAGADDYVTKPFDMEELEARIRAVLRRSMTERSRLATTAIQTHDLNIDLIKRRVTLKGEEVHLTPTEYKLLCLLATQSGRVLTFETLLDEIDRDSGNPKSEHLVRVYISALRKKLRDDATHTPRPLYIFSEPGIGYRFADLQPVS